MLGTSSRPGQGPGSRSSPGVTATAPAGTAQRAKPAEGVPKKGLTEVEANVVASIKAKGASGGVATRHDVFDGISLLLKSDQYGEHGDCQLDFPGRKTSDDAELPPKWSLTYLKESASPTGAMVAESFFGTRAPLRMYFVAAEVADRVAVMYAAASWSTARSATSCASRCIPTRSD
jgi:hypothetical protein